MDKITNNEPLPYRQVALHIAISYIGQQEIPKGSNWGPFVQECLKTVGIFNPAPWCMAVMYRIYKEAAEKTGQPNTCFRTGHVLTCWNMTPKDKRILKKNATAANVLAGYQFFMDFGKSTGHTGIVERIEGDTIHTLEGNTNDEGSREGYEFCRRTRSLKDPRLLGFAIR